MSDTFPVPVCTCRVAVVDPRVVLPDPSRTVGSHAVRCVRKSSRTGERDQLVGSCSPGENERSDDLSVFLRVDGVLIPCPCHAGVDKIRLVKVVHSMESEMCFDRGSVNVGAFACFLNSIRGQFERPEAQQV